MNQLTYAIIGFGNRGSVYAHKLKNNGKNVVAVCDPKEFKREQARALFPDTELFADEETFFKSRRADVLIIATMDKLHYRHAMRAIKLGYDLLLEKPICETLENCEEVAEAAEKRGVRTVICHVLRYTNFYSEIKRLISDGTIGKVINVQAAENVNLGHYISSFVRGRWNRAENGTPIIVQKCCHDFDIIYWFVGSKCTRVSSFGSLAYFKSDNRPVGAADYCYKCKRKDCLYNSIDLYSKYPASIDSYDFEHTPDGVKKLLSDESNPYSRCIFGSDNDVCDNQIVNMEFESGATASLTMTAFNQDGCRTIVVHGTLGTIEGKLEDGIIKVRLYDKEFGVKEPDMIIDTQAGDYYSHSGGDDNIIKDVIAYFENGERVKMSDISDAVMSHKMAFGAEKSRQNGGKPEIPN